jgi:8-oxo-dGTP diphosphatase
MSVFLIRHAHVGERRDWAGDDRLRPLSNIGHRQAARLANSIRPYSPERVLTSPDTRCLQTMTPLARWLGMVAEPTHHLAENAGRQALALIRAMADMTVALCTHGEVIAEVLIAIADEDYLDLGTHPRQARGSAWVLEPGRGRFLHARYLVPPPE